MLTRTLLLLPFVYVAAVLQTSLADVFRVGRVEPDLLAALAVAWLLVFPGPRSFLTAGVAGLAADLISPGRIGLAAACFLLVGYGVVRLRARLPFRHVVAQVAVVAVAVALVSAGVAFGRLLLGEATAAPSALLVRSLSIGAYSAGVCLPILMVVGWLQEPLRRRSATA